MTLHPDDITLAARVMTDIEPPSDLEARIKQRLDREAVRVAPRTTRFLWPAAGLAAAGLVALVVFQAPRSLGPEVQESKGPVVQGGAIPTIASSSHLPISSSPHLPVPAPIRLPAYRSISESELAWMSRRVPALDLIDPIQPEPVLITPLTMTPLMTSPMYGDSDEGREQFD